MKPKGIYFILNIVIASALLCGCASSRHGNSGNLQSFGFENKEADWIRNGVPIEFEGELWYPADGIESLTDAEVLPVVLFKDVQVFVDKIDVRPYDRLYTKFGPNKFRYYKRRNFL